MEISEVRILDKSRDYGTVHGDRGPGDPDAGVHFVQDGLPLNAQGHLVVDHVSLQGETKQAIKLREIAERKLKKATKVQQRVEAKESDVASEDDGVIDEGDPDDQDPVNLDAWARGEQRVEWNEVTQTIAQRYKKRVNSKIDALEFLIAEKVVSFEQLSPPHQKLMRNA